MFYTKKILCCCAVAASMGLLTVLSACSESSTEAAVTPTPPAPDPQWKFYVWQRNGAVAGYELEENPKVDLGSKVFTLTTKRTRVEYASADVLRFTLQDASVSDPAVGGQNGKKAKREAMAFNAGDITFEQLKAGEHVVICDATGRQILSRQADMQGCLRLSLQSLQAGTYTVNTESTSYTIQK